MSVLLAIISHPKDNALVARHWPYFKMAGWPILGCGTDDGKCEWPEAVPRLDTGQMGTKDTPAGPSIFGLVEQELDIWRYFLKHTQHESVCVVEADNLFTRKPPAQHPMQATYLVTLLPNAERPGIFKTPLYFSTPRWADRPAAAMLHCFGRAMLRSGDTEHFISDRFPARICYRHDLPFEGLPAWSPSVFVRNDADWIREARGAVGAGAWSLHAVKHQWQFEAVKDLLPCL